MPRETEKVSKEGKKHLSITRISANLQHRDKLSEDSEGLDCCNFYL